VLASIPDQRYQNQSVFFQTNK